MATIFSKAKWNNTTIKLIEGRRYRYQAIGRWKDWYIECDADGYTNFFMNLFKWLKRVPKAKWFQLIGAVDQDLSQPILLGKGGTFIAPGSGILWAFANDAEFAYGNNSGSLELQIDED